MGDGGEEGDRGGVVWVGVGGVDSEVVLEAADGGVVLAVGVGPGCGEYVEEECEEERVGHGGGCGGCNSLFLQFSSLPHFNSVWAVVLCLRSNYNFFSFSSLRDSLVS